MALDKVHTGELGSSTSSKNCPNVSCKMVKIKAHPDNTGYVYVGSSDGGVTVADGADDDTTGVPLVSGEESGWIPVNNLDDLAYIMDTAGDKASYMAVM